MVVLLRQTSMHSVHSGVPHYYCVKHMHIAICAHTMAGLSRLCGFGTPSTQADFSSSLYAVEAETN